MLFFTFLKSRNIKSLYNFSVGVTEESKSWPNFHFCGIILDRQIQVSIDLRMERMYHPLSEKKFVHLCRHGELKRTEFGPIGVRQQQESRRNSGLISKRFHPMNHIEQVEHQATVIKQGLASDKWKFFGRVMIISRRWQGSLRVYLRQHILVGRTGIVDSNSLDNAKNLQQQFP